MTQLPIRTTVFPEKLMMLYTCVILLFFSPHCDRDTWSIILRAYVGGVEFEKHIRAAAAKKKKIHSHLND